jgi:TonB-linked SusC/RagA family outer membrane protein
MRKNYTPISRLANQIQWKGIFSLILVVLLSVSAFAQQGGRIIKGTVLDEANGALPGVTVRVKGSPTAVSTNQDGEYSIRVNSAQDVLVFIMLGTVTQEIPVGTRANISPILKANSKTLNDVVVIGYGSSNKKDLTGSVVSIGSEDFNQGVMVNPAQLLQGKVAGLNVTRSGDPNKQPSTTLRGPSTFRTGAAQEPFYVIDGVPGASIDLLAPADIETIDILKDASSTAIYGSRASNGVIIVTTKKSKAGQTRLSYSGYGAVENVSKTYDMLTAPELRKYLADNGQAPLTALDDDGSDTDWQDLIQRTAYSQNHNVSYGGSGQSSDYGASVNYLNNEGVLKNTSLQRTIVRGFLNQRFFNDRLKLGVTISNSSSNRDDVYSQTTALSNMLFFFPTVSPFNADGTYKENYLRTGSGTRNPLSVVDNNLVKIKNEKTLINGIAQVNIMEGLKFTASLSTQKDQSNNNTYLNSQSGLARNANGVAIRSEVLNTTKIAEGYFNYDKTLGHHNLKFLAGYSWQEDKTNDGFGLQTQGFSNDQLGANNPALSNPTGLNQLVLDQTLVSSTLRLISFYGRAQYNFNEKYLLNASLRNDGSSAFGLNSRWGLFPAVSAGWRIISEDFMKSVPVVSDLKLRAGWGKSGNSLGFNAFSSLLVYGAGSKFYNNGLISNAIGPVRNENANLKWESTATSNIGVDFGLFKNRITGSIDYYIKKTSDLIYDQYAVSTTQYPTNVITANVGKIKNSGIEITLNAVAVKTPTFSWTTSPNISHNKNVVEALSDAIYKIDFIQTAQLGGKGQSGNYSQIIQPGEALGTFRLWNYAGKNAAGISTYVNAAGQTIASQPLTTDMKNAGNAQPKYIYGWNNSFNYKKWDLNFLVRGVLGNKILNATAAGLNTPADAKLQNIPRSSLTEAFTDVNAYLISDRYLESGSYLRMDNATLGYSIKPKSTTIKNIRLYFSANNLFVITKYSGIDPEIDMGGATPGIDNNNFYPKTRTLSFGVNASF